MPIVKTSISELEEIDFYPFKENKNTDLAMIAHIIYQDIDADQPATLSIKVINEVIRKKIGFNGLIMTDDISMKAIKISPADAAVKSLDSGCDLVLHCNGNMEEMELIAESINKEADLIGIPDNLIKIFDTKCAVKLNELKEELEKTLEALN